MNADKTWFTNPAAAEVMEPAQAQADEQMRKFHDYYADEPLIDLTRRIWRETEPIEY